MTEIYPNLYVGPEEDYYEHVESVVGWRVVQAANEPFHRKAVSSSSQELSSDHPEYLYAYRDNRIILNLIDAPIEVEIPKKIFDSALEFVKDGLSSGNRILIHCNQGVSRSASIGLLYLVRYTDIIPSKSHDEGMKFYAENIYPPFNPGKAIRNYLVNHWAEYAHRKTDG